MRFEHLADDACWQARPSIAGPAGTVTLSLDPVLAEFDLIDHGRLVRLLVFDDADDADGQRVLGDCWHELRHAADRHDFLAAVELAASPLWKARYDLAAAAQLGEDVARLTEQSGDTAAALAAAELADILHRLDELGLGSAEDSLQQTHQLLRQGRLDGRPEVPQAALERTVALARRLRQWAPDKFVDLVAALGDPVEGDVDQPPTFTARVTTAAATEPGLGWPWPPASLSADTISWDGSMGTFAMWPSDSVGSIQLHRHGAAKVEVPVADDGHGPWWALLFDHGTLVSGGPLSRHGEIANGWYGPLSRPPTSATVVHQPFQYPDDVAAPTARLDRAIRAAREALALEPTEPTAAAQRWRDSAHDWLGLNELGRAAIADDRAAAAFQLVGDLTHVGLAHERARAFAPAWALPYIHDRSGTPFRPLWADLRFLATAPGGGVTTRAPEGGQK